jgi:hypothetical protein
MNHDELMRIRAGPAHIHVAPALLCVCVFVCSGTYAGNIGICLPTSEYSSIISKNKLLYNTQQVFRMPCMACFHMLCCSKINVVLHESEI